MTSVRILLPGLTSDTVAKEPCKVQFLPHLPHVEIRINARVHRTVFLREHPSFRHHLISMVVSNPQKSEQPDLYSSNFEHVLQDMTLLADFEGNLQVCQVTAQFYHDGTGDYYSCDYSRCPRVPAHSTRQLCYVFQWQPDAKMLPDSSSGQNIREDC